MRLLSLDPGTANFGYAVIDVTHNKGKIHVEVLENGKCLSTVRTLKTAGMLRQEMAWFEFWLGDLVARWKPNAVSGERYMTRGINGPTVECVNIMLGIVFTLVPLPFKIMPAATWKNAIGRQDLDLKDWYKRSGVTPHQFDACMIGVYTACKAFGYKDFGPIDLEKLFRKLCVDLDATSTVKLVNRKAKAITE